jgi:hypothetical protein
VMTSNLTRTATLLIDDFGLKGTTFPVFKVDRRDVWLLIGVEISSNLRLEPHSHLWLADGVAVRFPAWGVRVDDF